MLSPSSAHSSSEPGPMPSLRRTLAGTEIRPCAVTFERAIAMKPHYRANELSNRRLVRRGEQPGKIFEQPALGHAEAISKLIASHPRPPFRLA